MNEVKPIEVWIDEHADDLRGNIVTHLNVMTDLNAVEREQLLRLIFISIKQWSEQ